MPGDNLVWQVDSLADFAPFVDPLLPRRRCPGPQADLLPLRRPRAARARAVGATVHHLRTDRGIRAVHHARSIGSIQEAGRGACFVFDCLSTSGRGLVQRSHAGQLLHAHLPLRLRPPVAGLFSAAAQLATASTPRRPSPRPRKSSSTSTGTRAALHASDQGAAPLLAHDVHAAPLGRRHSSCRSRESSTIAEILTVAALGRAGIGPPAAGQMEPHFSAGRGDLGRHSCAASGRPRTPTNCCPNCCAWPSRATSAWRNWSDATSRCPTCWTSGNG